MNKGRTGYGYFAPYETESEKYWRDATFSFSPTKKRRSPQKLSRVRSAAALGDFDAKQCSYSDAMRPKQFTYGEEVVPGSYTEERKFGQGVISHSISPY